MSINKNSSPPEKNNIFISPLTKVTRSARSNEEEKTHSLARRKLFEEQPSHVVATKVATEIDAQHLFKVYQIDFLHPKTTDSYTDFFALHDQLLLIEKFFNLQIKKPDLISAYQQKISDLLHSPTPHLHKMAELGLFYYYLDRNGKLPNFETTALDFRAREIETELAEIRNNHKAAYETTKLDIPSGKTHYLLRAFSHMVLSSEQKFNRGGACALRLLLTNPQYQISAHLKPEHYDHILIVLDRLLSKPQIKTLLETPFTIHADLEDLIRIDLKLPQDAPINSNLTLWDCLMALFFDVRQGNQGNCYAIGSLIYAAENGTYKLLTQMISYLKTGHFSINDTITVPIAPLVEKRLFLESDLNVPVSPENAHNLTAVYSIASTLSLSREAQVSSLASSGPRSPSLNQTLSALLKVNQREDLLPLAHKLYYSFKHNTLIQMVLAITEFHSCNVLKDREEFVDWILKAYWSSARNQPNEIKFRKMMRAKILEKIWFANSQDGDVSVVGKEVRVGPSHSQTIIVNFKGDLQALAEVFRKGRRLYYLGGGQLTKIETLTEFQKTLVHLVKQVELELPKDVSEFSNITRGFQEFYLSHTFRQALASYQVRKISDGRITGKDLSEIDLLIFLEKGGWGHITLEEMFKVRTVAKDFSSANPYSFLRFLSIALRSVDSNIQRSTLHYLARSPGHCFLLSPGRCQPLLEADFHHMMTRKVFNPLEKLMDERIPLMIGYGIIEDYAYGDKNLERKILETFEDLNQLTYKTFLKRFRSHLHPENEGFFNRIVDSWFSKKILSSAALTKTLQDFKIPLDLRNKLEDDLEAKFKNKPQAPYIYAKFLRKAFIHYRLGVFDTVKLESCLTEHMELPISFDIGDLNYKAHDSENPLHTRLVVRIHFGLGKLNFYYRDNMEILREATQFSDFTLYHPN